MKPATSARIRAGTQFAVFEPGSASLRINLVSLAKAAETPFAKRLRMLEKMLMGTSNVKVELSGIFRLEAKDSTTYDGR